LRIGKVTPEMIEVLDSRMNAKLTSEHPVRLYTHNADVDVINDDQLEKLPGDIHAFHAERKGDNKLAHGLLK
jgi:hypothetical protein